MHYSSQHWYHKCERCQCARCDPWGASHCDASHMWVGLFTTSIIDLCTEVRATQLWSSGSSSSGGSEETAVWGCGSSCPTSRLMMIAAAFLVLLRPYSIQCVLLLLLLLLGTIATILFFCCLHRRLRNGKHPIKSALSGRSRSRGEYQASSILSSSSCQSMSYLTGVVSSVFVVSIP